jgi:rubrerythrin
MKIPDRPSRYTQAEQLEILDNHPFFTNVCPSCGHQFDRNNPPKAHWDCPNPECRWVDDSV